MDVPVFLLRNKSNLGGMFETAGRKTSSTFFSAERYWDLICVKAEKVTSHKYVVLNGRSTFNAISAIAGKFSSSSDPEFSQGLFLKL